MKKLTVSFAILFIAFTSFTGFAADPTRPQDAAQLVSQAKRYASDGQLKLALEHYSRSIRVGKLSNPNYADLATQNKIVALIKEIDARATTLEVAQLIWQGDDYAATQPERALECYSRSIRVGKLHNDRYEDAQTQRKIVKLVEVLGNQLHL
jgi:hypothetical protein